MIFHSGGVFFLSICWWQTLSFTCLMLVIHLAGGSPKTRIIIVEKFDHIKKFRIFSNTHKHTNNSMLKWYRTHLFILSIQSRPVWACQCDICAMIRNGWFAAYFPVWLRGWLCACQIPIFLNGEEIRSGMDWTTLHTLENVVHSHSSHSIRIPKIKLRPWDSRLIWACECVCMCP